MTEIPHDHVNNSPVMARWVNGAWRRSTLPWRTGGGLNSVDALDTTSAWTVGRTHWPIAGRWNGRSWTKVQVPRPLAQIATLTDVAVLAADHAWVVGASLVNGQLAPLVMEYGPTPTSWRVWNPALAEGAESGFATVDAAPDGDVWIGGWRTENGQPRPWILRREASGWIETIAAPVARGRASITELAFTAPDDGWAVGYVESEGGGYLPLLQHWDGVSWSSNELPWDATDSVVLSGVTVGGNGSIVVVGAVIDATQRMGVLASRSGSSWKVKRIGGAPYPGSWMTHAAPLASGSAAVGAISDKSAWLVSCGTSAGVVAPQATAVQLTSLPLSDHARDEAPQRKDASMPSNEVPGMVEGLVARDQTAAAGLSMEATTWSGVVADFNGDSYTDIFINRHLGDVPRLMLGSGTSTFTALSYPWTWRDRHGCAAADVDGDATLDLLCAVGAERGTQMAPNELTLGPAADGGTNATEQYGLLDAFGRGRTVTFLNLNGDPYPDVYVTNEPDRIDAISSSNRLYRNVDGKSFAAANEGGLDSSMGGTCAVAADIDGDNDDDLMVCASEPADGLPIGARLLINTDGVFSDQTAAMGVTPMFDRDLTVADFNGDGTLDIAQLANSILRVSAGGPGGYTTLYERPLSGAIAMALGDVDMNDRPDIYVVQASTASGPDLMLVNDGDGASFSSMTIPQREAGSPEDVLAIDYDSNGRTDFLILNGRYFAGPIRLTAFFGAGT